MNGLFGKESVAPSQVKKYTAIVGSLFKGLHIVRKADGREDLVSVPIQYGPASVRNKQPDPSAIKTALVMPAMAFELVDIQPDETRRVGQHVPLKSGFSEPGKPFNQAYSLQPIPHNITYRLYIRSRHIEDGFQILEQIIGAFNPYITVNMVDSAGLGIERDIVVRLESGYEYADNYESSFETERFVEIGLTITVVGYIYKRIEQRPVVLELSLDVGDQPFATQVASRVEMESYLMDGKSQAVEKDMATVSKGGKNE